MGMDLELKERLKKFHDEFEGVKPKMYKCPAGFNTIGRGHNLDANPISLAAIDQIWEDDINGTYEALVKALPWFTTLDTKRKMVLLDMAFNMGVGGLLKFKNTLKFVQDRQYLLARSSMLQSKWASQVKRRATALADMMSYYG